MPSDLRRAQDDWNELGQTDPFWSVLTTAEKSGGRWSPDEFFATGRADIESALARLDELGIRVERGRAIDFGCGVGRVTQALADEFATVIGIDVAPSMIERARSLDQSAGRVAYQLNVSERLDAIETESTDFVYSSIVLQHVPARLAIGYISEFLRVLRPGGAAIFQLPTGTRGLSGRLKGLVKRLPRPILSGLLWALRARRTVPIGMHSVPLDRVRTTIVENGGELVDTREDDAAGLDWVSLWYVVRKPLRSAAAQPDRTKELDVGLARPESR